MSKKSNLLLGLVVLMPFLHTAQAANLKPETVKAWDDYIQEANIRVQQRLNAGSTFLWLDEVPKRIDKAKNHQIVVSPFGPNIPKKVPSGLIHDWIGGTFMPQVAIHDVLPVIRDYGRYKDFYQPNVVDSRTIQLDDLRDRFSTVLVNKAFFKKTALNSEYEASYFHIDERRVYAVSRSTHIQEIAEYGATGEHTLPEDQGTGLIWRLYTVVRLEERDGGVYMEVEAIALSRDVPGAIRLMAEPIVRRVSRDSLTTALKQMESAVRAKPAVIQQSESSTNPLKEK